MYYPENNIALFFCQQIAFCSFAVTRLCLYFRRYQLILKTKYKIWRVLSHCGQSYIQHKTPLFFYLNFFSYKTCSNMLFFKRPLVATEKFQPSRIFSDKFLSKGFSKRYYKSTFFCNSFKYNNYVEFFLSARLFS